MQMTNQADPALYQRIKKALRGAADATIARRLQVTKQAVSQWKKGITAPTAYKLIRVAEIANIPLEWLLTGDEKHLSSDKRWLLNESSEVDSGTLRDVISKLDENKEHEEILDNELMKAALKFNSLPAKKRSDPIVESLAKLLNREIDRLNNEP